MLNMKAFYMGFYTAFLYSFSSLRQLYLICYVSLGSRGIGRNERQPEQLGMVMMCVENCYKEERLLQMIEGSVTSCFQLSMILPSVCTTTNCISFLILTFTLPYSVFRCVMLLLISM
jgi:hypothetical protein